MFGMYVMIATINSVIIAMIVLVRWYALRSLDEDNVICGMLSLMSVK